MAVSRQGRPPRSSRSVHPNPLMATHLFAKSLDILGLNHKIAWYIAPEPQHRLIKNVSEWLVVVWQVTNPPPRKESLHNDPLVAKCNWKLGRNILNHMPGLNDFASRHMNGHISTPIRSQRLRFWGSAGFFVIYLLSSAPAPGRKLGNQTLRSLEPKTIIPARP